MRYLPCLNTSTIRPASVPDKIDAATRAGFRGIELWNEDVSAYVAGGGSLQEVSRRLSDCGLQVPSTIAIMGFIGNEEPGRDERLAEARRRMEQARELGSPFIVASPPMGRADLGRCADDYAQLLMLGREIGVRPAMEFLGFVEQVNNLRSAREIVRRAGDTQGTVVLDWFHMVRGDGRETMLEDLRTMPAAEIAILHLDDVPYRKPFGEMGDGDRVYPGDGDIPIDDLFTALEETGYRGPVSLELFNEALWQQDPYEVARTGYEKSRPWFERHCPPACSRAE
jgi:2-keto-myo-inositol isomerase